MINKIRMSAMIPKTPNGNVNAVFFNITLTNTDPSKKISIKFKMMASMQMHRRQFKHFNVISNTNNKTLQNRESEAKRTQR